jgi:hypothetical protein
VNKTPAHKRVLPTNLVELNRESRLPFITDLIAP